MDWSFRIKIKGEHGEIEMSQEMHNKCGMTDTRESIIQSAIDFYKEMGVEK